MGVASKKVGADSGYIVRVGDDASALVAARIPGRVIWANDGNKMNEA
jgi:hypothetical protein